MGLRLRTLVCALLVVGVALAAVAPAAAVVSDAEEGDREAGGDGESEPDGPVRNLTAVATGTVGNVTGTVDNVTETVDNVTGTDGNTTGTVDNVTETVGNATETVENVTNATAGTATTSAGGTAEVVGVNAEDTQRPGLGGEVVGFAGATATSVADGSAVEVRSDNIAVEVGTTTNAAPALTVEVPLGESTPSTGAVVPSEDTDAASEPTPEPPDSSASAGDDVDAATTPSDSGTGSVESTTADEAQEEESTAPPEDDRSEPVSLLGSLAWFDGAELLDYTPALGTAMFVAVAQPWTGFLSMSGALLVDWLGRFGAMFRFGRHDGSDPLEHETRERIHDRITETPGVSLSALAEDIDTPLSTVRHHLRVLERERLVSSKKLRGNRRLFPIGTENEELTAALEKDSSAAIIRVLRKYGAATVGDIVDEVETSYSTVSYHLSRLADDGLVVQEKDGASKVTRLAPSVRSALETADDGPARGGGREVSAD